MRLCRNSTPACPLVHTAASFLIFSPVCFSICCLSRSRLGASRLVLVSTHLYIAGLSPLCRSVCVTGKARSGRCALNTQLCLDSSRKTRPGEIKGEAGEEESTIDRWVVSPCPPLSPLSPSARRQQTTGIWREGGQREKEREELVLCFHRWPGESAGRGETWVGARGESTGLTSLQDPLHPLPTPPSFLPSSHCKQNRHLPPTPMQYLCMNSNHMRGVCRWS